MQRLVLIDGHAILHRAYHALPPLTNSKGELVNAVFGFTSMLIKVVADLKPTHLAVAFDRPKPTFRQKIFKKYQAQRPKMEEELVSQVETVHRVISEMGIPTFELDGYEADDVIGTIAKQVTKDIKILRYEDIKKKNKKAPNILVSQYPSIEVIIVTGDRDLLQLVSDKIKVYMPVKGLSESKLYGGREVKEKFGVKPSQIIDYKALVGDASDNYPGVAGVGPKTAESLLVRFQTIEQIYKHLEKIDSEKVRRALEENIDSAELAKKLATIVTDVPIEVDLEKCRLRNLDRPNIHHLFEQLEFRSLIPRLARNSKQETVNKEQRTRNSKQEIQNSQISLF